MDNRFETITVTPDGFLWWKGAKIQARLVPGVGLEFYEKDSRRAARCGGQLFVVPFEAILALSGLVLNANMIQVDLSDYQDNAIRKEGES